MLHGSYPSGGLLFVNGALYGTAEYGGESCGEFGCGTIFKLSPPAQGHSRWTYAAIHHFAPFPPSGVVDGTNPLGGLIADDQGVLYGTTSGGGLYGDGTVFKMPQDTGGGWNETLIHVFGGSELGDGRKPQSGPGLRPQRGALWHDI